MWKKLHRNLSELPKPEMDLLQKTFVRMDCDGDGKISLKDLHTVCAKLAYSFAKGELVSFWEVDSLHRLYAIACSH
jgi:Ca2+-binding EF-hand superfamily protein